MMGMFREFLLILAGGIIGSILGMGFGALVGADTLPVRKPDPAPLLEAIARVGGTSARTLLIGDTKTDRDTGLAAGVPVALVTFGPEGADVARMQPDALLDHYDDLGGIVGRFLP